MRQVRALMGILTAVTGVLSIMTVSSRRVDANESGVDLHNQKVSTCHAIGADGVRYRQLSVAFGSIVGEHGHDGHQRDIIPPFSYRKSHRELADDSRHNTAKNSKWKQRYAGKNWDASHRAVYDDDWVGSPPTTEPTTTSPTTTTIPATTVPASTTPATTVPAITVPATTVPAITVPATTVPASTTPVATVPAITVPSTTSTTTVIVWATSSPPVPPARSETAQEAIAPTTAISGSLPSTGSYNASMVLLGGLLIALGLAMLLTSRRPAR